MAENPDEDQKKALKAIFGSAKTTSGSTFGEEVEQLSEEEIQKRLERIRRDDE